MTITPPPAASPATELPANHSRLAIVVIGRNEGARLIRCLDSLVGQGALLVYVDSGSTDNSLSEARSRGALTVELERDHPFTAGRARNAGFHAARTAVPRIEYVQFVDGDCEVAEGWLDFAAANLDQNPGTAIVCGRRKERFPERTIYNRLCDIEWDTPVGEADACGGDFMARAEAFTAVDGFNNMIIAGEEPELCFRLRDKRWRITRADRLMTIHDANIFRLRQWARRAARSGYAYAARAALHWRAPGGYCRRENLRIVGWAAALPIAAMLGSLFITRWSALLLLAYPIQFVRVRRQVRKEHPTAPAGSYAFFLLLGKWPEFWGQLMFLARLVGGREQRIIEYK
jgi:glycosyltransferase involved in cell wall biosynthesis